MSRRYPIIRSLDPYHQRLGYLNGVVMVAERGLDRREALTARFQDMMFEKVYRDEERWALWFAQATHEGQGQIESAMTKAMESDPAAILLRNRREGGWSYAQDLWIHDRKMPSSLGAIPFEEDKLSRPIELAKWMEIILPTYELSETGVVLRALLDARRAEERDRFNPLRVEGLHELQLIYLRSLLRSES